MTCTVGTYCQSVHTDYVLVALLLFLSLGRRRRLRLLGSGGAAAAVPVVEYLECDGAVTER